MADSVAIPYSASNPRCAAAVQEQLGAHKDRIKILLCVSDSYATAKFLADSWGCDRVLVASTFKKLMTQYQRHRRAEPGRPNWHVVVHCGDDVQPVAHAYNLMFKDPALAMVVVSPLKVVVNDHRFTRSIDTFEEVPAAEQPTGRWWWPFT